MKKILFLVLIACFMTALVQAQCDDCPKETYFTADFCYTNELLPNTCAQFSNASAYCYLSRKNKNIKITFGDKFDMGYFMGLANTKSLKLSAKEMIFLMEAIKAWDKASFEQMVEKGKDIALEKEGYNTLPSGLGIKVMKEGTGPQAAKGQTVEVHYRGVLEDGTEFDNSFKRGNGISFPLGAGRVIKGWDEGIAQLKVGSAAWLKIPADLGYGERGVGPIPANATLYFYVVLVDAK